MDLEQMIAELEAKYEKAREASRDLRKVVKLIYELSGEEYPVGTDISIYNDARIELARQLYNRANRAIKPSRT